MTDPGRLTPVTRSVDYPSGRPSSDAGIRSGTRFRQSRAASGRLADRASYAASPDLTAPGVTLPRGSVWAAQVGVVRPDAFVLLVAGMPFDIPGAPPVDLPDTGPAEPRLSFSAGRLSVHVVVGSDEIRERLLRQAGELTPALATAGFSGVELAAYADPGRLVRDRATDDVPREAPRAGCLPDIRA